MSPYNVGAPFVARRLPSRKALLRGGKIHKVEAGNLSVMQKGQWLGKHQVHRQTHENF